MFYHRLIDIGFPETLNTATLQRALLSSCFRLELFFSIQSFISLKSYIRTVSITTGMLILLRSLNPVNLVTVAPNEFVE